MEALKIALFENPLGIYIALAIIAILGLVSYKIWGTLKSAWPTGLALIVGVAVYAISTLVVTDREKIRAACDEIAQSVNIKDVAGVERFLDKDFSGRDQYETRKKAVQWLRRSLKEYGITNVAFKILSLNIQDDLATMVVLGIIESDILPRMWTKWRVVWRKRSTGWLVYKARGFHEGPGSTEDQ
ncbi:MAG: hypothetical protein QGG42_15520 [Phycisphaerae bacterium]|jgi:hypothetical protein|nr:hypothetical protein [Phycisphaerae bacterium]